MKSPVFFLDPPIAETNLATTSALTFSTNPEINRVNLIIQSIDILILPITC